VTTLVHRAAAHGSHASVVATGTFSAGVAEASTITRGDSALWREQERARSSMGGNRRESVCSSCASLRTLDG
jgi:hypothetical protein